MAYGFQVEVWGDYACFSRPELKVERVSYDVITPSAARGLLEAVFWKPAIRYVIDEIAVCAPIRFDNIRRNEVNSKASSGKSYIAASNDRVQRAAMLLRSPRYVITYHFELTKKAGERDNEGKFTDSIRRRLEKGQHYHMPYLGNREFPAHVRLIGEGEMPPSPILETRSLGLMFYDFTYDWTKDKDGDDIITAFNPSYFQAEMVNGVIDLRNVEVLR
ncbi:type I-C CRISPR-associated protein Cas5 [Clostridia bacterium]|nr:type I-C CRISPR-associated protein Cas5 [Clostridia bacterium]